MPQLIKPATRLHQAWLDSLQEWGPDAHQDGAGLRPGDETGTPEAFARWVERLLGEEDVTRPAAPGWVHCTYRWMAEGDRLLGTIALRHELNEFLLERGGHIGYAVRPSERRRGLAGWAVAETLGTARQLGLDRVLICCDDDNEASARTIEGAGGVLEDKRHGVRRYWVRTAR